LYIRKEIKKLRKIISSYIKDKKLLSRIYFNLCFFLRYKKIYYNTEYYLNDDVDHSLSNKFIRLTFAPIIKKYINNIYNVRLKKIKKTQYKIKPISVLDVGCGNSRLFNYLDNKRADFIGIDPLDQISGKFFYNSKFFKCNINNIKGKFDLIIFFGSFRIIYKQFKFRLFEILKNLSNKDTVIICYNAGYYKFKQKNETGGGGIKIELIKDSILNQNKFTVFKIL